MNWQNKTEITSELNKIHVLKCQAPIAFLRSQPITNPNSSNINNKPDIFISASSFDCYYAVYRYYSKAVLGGDKIALGEVMKVQTHNPICFDILEYQWSDAEKRNFLVGYLWDIFGNIYKLNVEKIKIRTSQQKVKRVQFITIHKNLSHEILQNTENIHKQVIMSALKSSTKLFWINIQGTLKTLDLAQRFQSEYNVKQIQFPSLALASVSYNYPSKLELKNNVIQLQPFMAISFNNGRFPLILSSDLSLSQMQQKYFLVEKQHQKMKEKSQQVTYVVYEPKIQKIITSTVSNHINIYNFSFQNNLLICVKTFTLKIPSRVDFINSSQSCLTITAEDRVILMNLQKNVKMKEVKVQNLRWCLSLECQLDVISYSIVSKGYNQKNQNMKDPTKRTMFRLYEIQMSKKN